LKQPILGGSEDPEQASFKPEGCPGSPGHLLVK